jgi:cell division protein FtsB
VKENSREEDIALIEKSLCDKDTIIQYHYWVGTDFLNAVERIVADYKRVLKENEELKNNTRKNENELEFDIDCDWIALQKMLDESEKSNEYISYKNEKWIKEKYCIPIQKVKDKIEELKKKVEELTDEKGYWGGSDLLEQIKVLQELLEKEQ